MRRAKVVLRGESGSERGMSLTELVVVVAVLAILVAIAVPVYLNIQDQGRDAALQTTLRNFHSVYEYEVVKGQTAAQAISVAMNLNNNEIVAYVAGGECVSARFVGDESRVWRLVLEQTVANDYPAGSIVQNECSI